VHAGLADEHRAAGAQPFDDRGIVVRHMILEQFRAASGAHAFGAEEILDRDRNAMQRTAAFAATQFLIGLFGALAGGLGHHGLHGVGRGVEPFDALERRGSQLRGRYFAPAQGGGGFEQRHSPPSHSADGAGAA